MDKFTTLKGVAAPLNMINVDTDMIIPKNYLKTMRVRQDTVCTYLYFPLLLNEEATDFVNYMQENEITVRRYYTANHDLKYYKGRYRTQDISFTEAIKNNIVSLPLHTVMSEEELSYLFTTVENYFTKFGK